MIDQPSDICNMQSFTDGLVGFLFNACDINNKQWKDEYLYANATVTNGIKVENGFKFDKAGAGAKWPVDKQREEQPYNFTDPGFTLVATVTVDNVSHEKDNSVFGVSYLEDYIVEKRVGLWCTTEGKWRVKSKEKSFRPGNAEILSETVINGDMCVKGKTYLVALLLNDGKFSVHVNGEQVGTASKDILINKTTTNITHFYFGADNSQIDGVSKGPLSVGQTAQYNSQQNDEESHVTVRNVLLYNRPFSDDEMTAIKAADGDSVDSTNVPNGKENTNTRRDDGTKGGSGDDGGKEPSESSTVRGGVVGVLFSMVLSCASALTYSIIDNV